MLLSYALSKKYIKKQKQKTVERMQCEQIPQHYVIISMVITGKSELRLLMI